ncbi:MAG TPA: four helix bundle protein [Gemmatimonadaceae bacterium]|nr:four helix bundle protein [Gemmatimonadaceae bacterium]
MRAFRKIEAWQKGMDLITEIYRLTRRFPREELFCLTFQLRKAALRIPSCIAEGTERDTAADRRHFLTVARGSVAEIETQLEAAVRLEYVELGDLDDVLELTDHLGGMLTNLRRNIRDRPL